MGGAIREGLFRGGALSIREPKEGGAPWATEGWERPDSLSQSSALGP